MAQYKKIKRDTSKKEIRRLILQESLSTPQIAQRLQISLRSAQRWINQMYSDDSELLKSIVSEKDSLSNWLTCRDRMDQYRLEVLDLARNPDVPASDRIKGYHLVAEIEAAIQRMQKESVLFIARSSPHTLPPDIVVAAAAALSHNGNSNSNNNNNKKKEEEYVPLRSLSEEPPNVLGEEESTASNNKSSSSSSLPKTIQQERDGGFQ